MTPRRSSRIEAAIRDGEQWVAAPPRASKGFVFAVILVVVILATQLGIAILGAIVGVRESENAAEETFARVGDVTAERVARNAQSVANMVEGTAVSLEITNGRMDLDTLAAQMHQRLVRMPEVRAIYVGYADGSFIELRREGGEIVQFRSIKSPVEEQIRSRHDLSYQVLDSERVSVDFDPRVRPWYELGEQAHGTVWTDPFLALPSGRPAASAARPALVDGEVFAVAGADLNLDRLALVLDRLPVGDGAQAFVLGADRQVIAAPSQFDDEILRLSTETGLVPQAEDLGLTSAPAPADTSQQQSIWRDGDRFVLERPFNSDEGLPWILHLEADEHQLSPGLQRVQVTMAWVTTLSMILVTLAFVLLYRLWQPLIQMRARATTDPLTGLVNRHDLESRGARMVESAHRSGESVVLQVIDLDNFKALNDTLGHQVGDQALKVTAATLVQFIRERDIAARLGGDEFVVLQRFSDQVDVPALVARTRARVDEALSSEVEGGSDVGATAGFSVSREDQKSLEVLLYEADQALVHGKRRKKGRVYGYDDLLGSSKKDDKPRGSKRRRSEDT